MDVPDSASSIPAPAGFPSERARRTLILVAGIAGLLSLLVQTVVLFSFFFAAAVSIEVADARWREWPHLWDAVYWDGSLWYIQEALPRRMEPREEATLQKLDPRQGSPAATVASVYLEDPHLLVGTDRLWVISPEDVRYFRGGRATSVNVRWRLGDISPPFLLDGSPAVYEQRPAGTTLDRFKEVNWQRGPLFHLPAISEKTPDLSRLQVVRCGGRYQTFLEVGTTLYHREGLPGEDDAGAEAWEPVVKAGRVWTAACVEDQPTLFAVRLDHYRAYLQSFRKVDRGWSARGDLDLNLPGTDVGVVPVGGDSRVFVLASRGSGGIGLLEVRDGKLEKSRFYSPAVRPQAVPGPIARIFAAGFACLLALPVLLALVLSATMARWRIARYTAGPATARLAPLWRRAFAGVIDRALLGVPPAAGYLLLAPRLRDLSAGPGPGAPGSVLLLILGGLAWSVAGFLAFSFLEGKWGATPGKWVTGIRVLGTDLRPCGFLRGLVRNLLRAADGLFDSLVGILTATLSRNWQRVGDMGARTVVVRRESVRLDPAGSVDGSADAAPPGTEAGSGG